MRNSQRHQRQKSQSEANGTVNNNNLVESTPVNQKSSTVHTSASEEDSLPQVSSPGMVVILSDHFKVLSEPAFSKSRLKKFSVRLTDTHLAWGSFETQSILDASNLTVLPIPEVIGTQVKDGNLITSVTSTASTVAVDSVAISVFAYPFKDNPSRSIYNSKSIPRRVRKTVTFIVDSGSSYRENLDTADKWSRAIEWLVFDKTLVKASSK